MICNKTKAELPPKLGIHPRQNCFMHAMPAFVGGTIDAAAVKWVSYYPNSTPSINGMLFLSNVTTGKPLAIAEASHITAMRTGAAVGVAAKHCANWFECCFIFILKL